MTNQRECGNNRGHRGAHKRVFEDQIFGRVTGNAKLGPHHQIGALPRGRQTSGPDFVDIAIDIPDNGVQLGERDVQGISHGSARLGLRRGGR